MASAIVFAYPALLAAAIAVLVLSLAGAVRAACAGASSRSAAGFLAPLALILALGAVVRLSARADGPHLHDGHLHADIARNLRRTGSMGISVAGNGAVEILRPTNYPGAIHFAFAAFLPGGGDPLAAARRANLALGLLGVAVSAALAALVWGSAAAGVAAATMTALLPLHARHSAALDLSAGSFLAVSLWALADAAARARPSLAGRVFAAASGALALNARPENAALLPALAGSGGRRAALLAAAVPVGAIVAYNAVSGVDGYSSPDPAALAGRLRSLAVYAFSPETPAPLLLALAAAGLLSPLDEGRRFCARAVPAAAFLAAVSAVHSNADFSPPFGERYALTPCALLIPAAAGTAAGLGPSRAGAAAAALAAWIAFASPGLARLSAPPGAHEAERMDLEFLDFARRAVSGQPARSCLITYSPSLMRATVGLGAVNAKAVAEDPGMLDRLAAAPGGCSAFALLEDPWRFGRHAAGHDALKRALAREWSFVERSRAVLTGREYALLALEPKP